MTVDDLISNTIKREGGYVNNLNDKGGATKFGITQSTLEAWRGHPVTAACVKDLTYSEAADIYKRKYFIDTKIASLPEILQPVVFDMAVNMGAVEAVKIMQRVISKMGKPVVDDGYIGANTCQSATIACNVYHEDVIRQITDARIAYYRQLVAWDSSQGRFLYGWINRAREFV